MILTHSDQKVNQLQQVFSWVELCFHPQLIKDSENLIKQFETEKSTSKHTINFQYGADTRVQRVWNGLEKTKACYPQHLEGKKWVSGIGENKLWMPYHWQDLQFCKGKIALLHEGEKACEYARSKGLISFSFLGAKVKDKDFVKSQLEALKNFDLGGLICIIDNDEPGESYGELIKKITKEINLPCLIVPIKLIFPEAQPKDDFADYVKANKNKGIKEIKADVELAIEQDLEMLIANYLEDNKKFSLAEIKPEIERLLTSDLEDFEINLEIENLRNRLDQAISEYSWNRNYVNPLKQKHKKQRAKLEIQAYLQADDPFDKVSLQQKIQQIYGYSKEQFQFLVKAVENLQTTPAQDIKKVSELLADKTQQSWLIPSLLPYGQSLLIHAAPKTGKSILASEIMRAIITGGKFLGEEINQGKVLYCYSDEGEFSFKERLFLMGFDLLLEDDRTIDDRLIPLSSFNLFDLSRLEKHLDTYRPQLVVLDSLRSIASHVGLSENDVLFVQHLYNVKKLLDKYSTTTIFIHHDNKAGQAAGNLGIEGAVWGVCQLTNEQGAIVNDDEEANGADFNTVWSEDYRYLHLKRARSAEPQKWKLFLNNPYEWTEKGIYEFLGDADDPSSKKQEAINLISDYLKANSNSYFEVEEIEKDLLLPRPSIYRSLQKLERSQKVTKKRSTYNKKRWAFQWILNNNNLQQGILKTVENSKVEALTTPPPLTRDNLENQKPETIATNSDSQIITVDYHGENDDNDNLRDNLRDNLQNQDTVSDSESDYQIITPTGEGGVGKDDNLNKPESTKIPYCKQFSNEKDLIGLKVSPKDSPETEGEIIEIKKLGSNYSCEVQFNDEIKTFWLTALTCEELDFKAWRNEQINGV